ncbi:hypothetical protein JG687_00003839 [Phytophthora cactorum]|uniref:Tetratricopeptide-like helical domain n=1 Tax=Phytophthora cactorum TaxID=29920 RepID=A0A8T1URM0_9STRA|nr:hypothetical protein JG687_00003839 [Phytophthora cactorum]
MQRVLSAWRKSRGASAKEGHEELQKVLAKLRKLGRRATLEELTLVDAMQFKESPLVAKLNSPIQFHGLGNMIYNNSGDNDEEVQKALHVWKIAMDKGSEKAKFSYALCMKKGIGFAKKDAVGATKYFKELTATGHGWGTFAYADALNNGEGTRKNEKKAFELYKKCAETGVPPAYMNVSNMYTSGTGTQKYYKEAATAGIVLAQYNLGYLFLTGDGVPQDPLQAEALFRKAAEKGFVMAMVNLAQMYRTGYGKVPKELETARKWLELAAPHDPNAKELLKAMTEADTTKEIASKN